MRKEFGATSQAKSNPPDGKKTYTQPALQTYGSLHVLTQGSKSVGQDGGNTLLNRQSDRAIKENIVRIDDHPSGIGIYRFQYKPSYQARCGYGNQVGVMADEVEKVLPEAVSVHPEGYRLVDYALLHKAFLQHPTTH